MDSSGRAGAVDRVFGCPSLSPFLYSLCMGTMGVCGGEGAVRTAGGGLLLALLSPSEVGPEPLRTELRRSANFVAAGFRMGGGDNTVN